MTPITNSHEVIHPRLSFFFFYLHHFYQHEVNYLRLTLILDYLTTKWDYELSTINTISSIHKKRTCPACPPHFIHSAVIGQVTCVNEDIKHSFNKSIRQLLAPRCFNEPLHDVALLLPRKTVAAGVQHRKQRSLSST